MTTIKFKRPDGEARLSWTKQEGHSQGGWVTVHLPDGAQWIYNSDADSLTRLDEWLKLSDCPDPDKRRDILRAAESLRNEKRALAENEWRGADGRVWAFSRPTLTGFHRSYTGWDRNQISEWRLGPVPKQLESEGWYIAALKWHRTAFLPILPDDCCYPPNDLPRRMTDDEARFPDGSAGRMVYREWSGYGPPAGQDHYTHCIDIARPGEKPSVWWTPTTYPEFPTTPDHPLHTRGQLARLQSFWDANQPKEAELNLRWHAHNPRIVEFDFGVSRGWLYSGTWSPLLFDDMSPAQRSAVEAFFAAGPPVELAEFPLSWPRALAYFDKRAKPAEPARVTDVRLDQGEEHWLGPRVVFKFLGRAYFYAGKWGSLGPQSDIHPLDIALIERCWAEGRLGEREVLADDGTVLTVEWHVRERRFIGRFVGGHVDYISFGGAQEVTSDDKRHWWWPSCKTRGLVIDDPAQRARVRAIVAGLKTSGTELLEKGAEKQDAESTGREQVDAVVTEAHSVTPSGEVKAPEDFPDGMLLHPHGRLVIFGGRSVLCHDNEQAAALSDHIRRGDGVDLTELRGAWKNWTPGKGSLDGFNDLMAAVERLVGK